MGLRTRNIGRLIKEVANVQMVGLSATPWTAEQISQVENEFEFKGFFTLKAKSRSLLSRIKKDIVANTIDTHELELSSDDQKVLDDLIKEADVVWVHTLRIANIIKRYHWGKTVIDLDDYPSQFHWTVAKNKNSPPLERLLRVRRSLIWKRREQFVKDRFSSLVVCKENDRGEFDCADRTYVVGNGFERLPIHRNVNADAPRLGMIGNFKYRLNWESIEWFIESCWPKIRELSHATELRLVGRGSESYTNESLGIVGLGFVDDPATELASWNALIAPVSVGGGTSVKIADAFARKIPVVSTSHGARGYIDETNKTIHVADDAENFILGCEKVINDEAYASELAENAWRYFDQNLAWDTMLPQVTQAIENALKS